MSHFVFNIVLTVYFGLAFLLSIVYFFVGPLIQVWANERKNSYTGVNLSVELVGSTFHLWFFGEILKLVLNKIGYNTDIFIPAYCFCYAIFIIRNIIYNAMFSDDKKFSINIGITTFVYWVIVWHGIYLIWN